MTTAFTAASTHGLIQLSDYIGKWVVLFCTPGEFGVKQRNDWLLIMKNHRAFSSRDIQLVGMSMDQKASHLPWLNSVYKTRVTSMPFPVIDDRKGTIGKALGINQANALSQSTSLEIFIFSPNQNLSATYSYRQLTSSKLTELLRKIEELKDDFSDAPHRAVSVQSKTNKSECDVVPIVGEYVLGDPINVDPTLLDFVIYAFAQIKPDGTFEPYSTRHLREMVNLKTANPDLKVLMAIGGWGAEGFSDAALTPASRYAFAREAKRWVDQYDLDGIDLDWEYPGNSIAGIKSRPQDKQNFTLLITALRDVLGPNKWITVAGTGDALYTKNVEIAKIAPLINYFNLMAYDFNGGETGETAARHQSNLYTSPLSLGATSVDNQIENLIANGMPSEKILMGLPFYGRYGAISTKTFDQLRKNYINTNGYTVRWDEVAKAPYIVDASGNFTYSFDNPVSIYYKGLYVLENCLGGLFSWQSTMDSANILAAAMSAAVNDPEALRDILITEYAFTP